MTSEENLAHLHLEEDVPKHRIMENETTTQKFDPELLEGFRKVAESTRQEKVWYTKIYPQIPPESTDFVLDLVGLRAKLHGIALDEEARETLAQEYDDLREVSGLSETGHEEDSSIDHLALIDFFLEKKGLFAPVPKPQESEIVQPPTEETLIPEITPELESAVTVPEAAPETEDITATGEKPIFPTVLPEISTEEVIEAPTQVAESTEPVISTLESPVTIEAPETIEPIEDQAVSPQETDLALTVTQPTLPTLIPKKKPQPDMTRRDFNKALVATGLTFFGLGAAKLGAEKGKEDFLASAAAQKAAEIVPNATTNPMTPFVKEALINRSKNKEIDPAIDTELNEGRVNFLITSLGSESVEGRKMAQAYASETIISYDTKTNTFDLISLDNIRAPEIEGHLTGIGKQAVATPLEKAYQIGGFDLTRKILQNATGLKIDFQINATDQFFVDLVDRVLDGVVINSPFKLNTRSIFINESARGPEVFPIGPQNLNGERALAFMKGQPNDKIDKHDPSKDRSRRKLMIIEGIINRLPQAEKLEIWKYTKGLLKNNIDFDPRLLSIQGNTRDTPKVNQKIVVGDRSLRAGDGGVENIQISRNDITKQDRDIRGVYKHEMEIPLHSNPYAEDLVKSYWPSVRELIKNRLLPK